MLGDPTVYIAAVGMLAVLPVTWQAAQAQAFTDKPAAIIEDIEAPSTGLELMEFLYTGDAIRLTNDETMKISYLRSCVVEEFKGGVVTIGETESVVTGDHLQFREQVNCDGGGIVPTNGQREDAAGIVFRIPDSIADKPIKIFGTSPIFVFSEHVKELMIRREDSTFSKEEYQFLVNGNLLDLIDRDVQLTSGGVYLAKTKHGAALFQISPNAKESDLPKISRLIGF